MGGQSICDPENRWGRIVTLSVVSSPVFLAWVASPKLMPLLVAMITAALAMTVSSLSTGVEETRLSGPVKVFVGICVLVMVVSVEKMNFLLSEAIVGTIAFGSMVRRPFVFPALAIGLFGAALIMVLLTPFQATGLELTHSRRCGGYRDTQVPFPLLLALPAGSGTITTVLGLVCSLR
jgi:hypothetical protein